MKEPQKTKHIFRKHGLLLATIILLAGHNPIIDIKTHAVANNPPAGNDQSHETQDRELTLISQLIENVVQPILEKTNKQLEDLQKQAAQNLPQGLNGNSANPAGSKVATEIEEKAQKLINNLEKQKGCADIQAIQTDKDSLNLLIAIIKALVSQTDITQEIINIALERINEHREATIQQYIKEEYTNSEEEINPREIATAILLSLIEQQNACLEQQLSETVLNQLKTQIKKAKQAITLLSTLTQNQAHEGTQQVGAFTLKNAYKMYRLMHSYLNKYRTKSPPQKQPGESSAAIKEMDTLAGCSPVAFVWQTLNPKILKYMKEQEAMFASIEQIIKTIIDNNLWDATEDNNHKIWELSLTTFQLYMQDKQHQEFLKSYIKLAYKYITGKIPGSLPHRAVNQQIINYNQKLIRSANKQWIDLVDTTLDDAIKYLPAIINNLKTVENKLLLLPHRIPTSQQSGNNKDNKSIAERQQQ